MSVQLTEFRELHRPGQPLVLPNAWDHASAAALVQAGFAAIGTTSLGIAAAHGLPDGVGATRAETVALAGGLAYLPCLLTVDIEGGFSADPEDVGRLAALLAELGAVGINIEDGRADGSLAPIAVQCELIESVRACAPGLFINARTDTYWLPGPDRPDLAATLERVDAYVAAGADGIFVPGLARDDDIRTVVARTTAPLNVLFLPRHHTVARLADCGVSRISTGSLLFRAALHATVTTALALGRAQPSAGIRSAQPSGDEGEPLPSPPDDLPGYAEVNELGTRYR